MDCRRHRCAFPLIRRALGRRTLGRILRHDGQLWLWQLWLGNDVWRGFRLWLDIYDSRSRCARVADYLACAASTA